MENKGPDYSRSHFDSAFNKKPNDKGNKPTGDIFGDLLGSQGYDFASKKETGPRTMNQLRKEDLVKELDPDRVKVCIVLLDRWCFCNLGINKQTIF